MSSTSNFQNIIDLSKSKRSAYRPKNSGEIVCPPSFYKLFAPEREAGVSSDSLQEITKGSSIFQSYYELPSIDVINEWVIVLESLLNEVYSVQGCEAVLLEALTQQCMMTLLLEQDADSSFKVL